MKVKLFSHVWLFATPWTAAHRLHGRLLRPWDFPGKSTGVGGQVGNRMGTNLKLFIVYVRQSPKLCLLLHLVFYKGLVFTTEF